MYKHKTENEFISFSVFHCNNLEFSMGILQVDQNDQAANRGKNSSPNWE